MGLGRHINNVMQTAFFNLCGLFESSKDAINLMYKDIEKTYHHKGPKVIEMNKNAVDASLKSLFKINVKSEWVNLPPDEEVRMDRKRKDFTDISSYITEIMDPLINLTANSLPVSKMTPGGHHIMGTTEFEKRELAPQIPIWIPDNCTQCN